MVFDVADPAYPLCALTAQHTDSRAIYRVIDPGPNGVLQATLTVLCPPEVGLALAKELSKSSLYEQVEVASLSPYAIVFRLGYRASGNGGPGDSPARAFAKFQTVFGVDTLVEPFLVEGGRIRVRAIAAEPLDTKRALVKLQELQREMSWADFRVVRVNEFKATRYADSLRRMLEADQEDLLRLAVGLGYYDTPKRCTLQDLADRVGLSVSPVHKKLKNVEQVLVSAYIAPATLRPRDPRRRPRPAPPQDVGPGAMAEITVRVQWPDLIPAAFTARHPGSLVILQPLVEEPQGRSVSLLIVVAPAMAYREILDDLARRPEVEAVDSVSRETDHVSMKIRSRVAPDDVARGGALPPTSLLRRVGRGASLKPVLFEAGDTLFKAILTHPASYADVQRRLTDMAADARWRSWEVVSLRRIEFDPALSRSPIERITVRQTEILKIAHALGYYRTPRGCTLDDVAKTLGISANAVHKNLTAAEHKIVTAYLADAFWQC